MLDGCPGCPRQFSVRWRGPRPARAAPGFLYFTLHGQEADRDYRKMLAARRLGGTTGGAFIVIVVANLLSVIAEAGFKWHLPPDPVGYLLFKK